MFQDSTAELVELNAKQVPLKNNKSSSVRNFTTKQQHMMKFADVENSKNRLLIRLKAF